MKGRSKVLIYIIALIVIVGVVIGTYFIRERGKSYLIGYQNKSDGYKLYIKNEQTNEDRLLVDIGIINVCTVNDWVYYMTGDFEGVFKIRTDGTENTKVAPIESMPTIVGNSRIESSVKNGNIIYTIIQLKEIGSSEGSPDSHYQLSLKDDTITRID